jgi:uncharacterized membrane protein
MPSSIDLKALKIYQQVFIYITPIVTNLGLINIAVVVVRLHWFRKRFRRVGMLFVQSDSNSLKLMRWW